MIIYELVKGYCIRFVISSFDISNLYFLLGSSIISTCFWHQGYSPGIDFLINPDLSNRISERGIDAITYPWIVTSVWYLWSSKLPTKNIKLLSDPQSNTLAWIISFPFC